ncbi:MAG: hypothetical protein LLG42_16565 [Chloroflexi bacterium]|nr:hypothetical protein [Chloroflexota bacterium]
MSRVIQTDTGKKERDRYLKAVVKALRLLMTEQEPGEKSNDLVSFIALALYEVHETIDASVRAWEKRDYWIKADRYRMEWDWCQYYGRDLHMAILKNDWDQIIPLLVKIGQKLQNIKMPQHDRLGTPWLGSWEVLKKRPIPKD